MIHRSRVTCILTLFLSSALASASAPEPDHRTLFLTWQQDPTTTMTLQWMQPGTPAPLAEGHERLRLEPYAIPYAAGASLENIPDNTFSVEWLVSNQPVPPAPEDLSADVHLAWNETGLYVWFDVRDDDPLESEEISRLPGRDSIELFISTGVGEEERYQLVIAPGRDPNHPEPRLGVHDFRSDRDAADIGAEFRSEPGDDGYRVSVRFPLTDLGMTPEQDQKLGFGFYINDRDSEGPWQWLSWHPSRGAHGNPASVMPLRLTREAGPPHRVLAVVAESEEGPILTASAVPELVGREAQVWAGKTLLGSARFEAGKRKATFTAPLPEPPSGKRWKMVHLTDTDGNRLAQVELPGWLQAVDSPAPMKLHHYRDGHEKEITSTLADLTPLRAWNGMYLHRLELTGLKPDTLYRFRLGDSSRTYAFRTMPADNSRPIRFAAGGDTRHRQEWMEAVNRQAMKVDLDFIAWGGDLAYADGLYQNLYRWDEWFEANYNTLIDEDGRVIPIILTIGNHEVVRGYYTNHPEYEQTDAWRDKIAPYYYQLFAFPGQPGWGVLDFGHYMSMIFLDTNHSNPIAGKQTDWLEQALAERKGRFTHILPTYHVPAYPSVRNYEGGTSRQVREHWLHLFEKSGVQVAFENHDHVYKRTHPLRGGIVDPDGIIYVGDGAWGVGVREHHPVHETWYLARAESMRHAIWVTVDGPDLHFEVVNEDGHIIDDFRIRNPSENL